MESQKIDQFEILAQKVEALIDKCQDLKKAKQDLQTLLSRKQEEIEALKKKALIHEQEKAQVRTKIDDLLSRIEKFETG
ncbi:MAG: hypothetical protein JRG97_06845 [Deltaproteobacteria bacterium]|nr:hypothetical protein [Deltaproteobacteria bacterium]MBW2052203.1 hypothetical protein [Deltaproteobacteria bacterium]MBW2140774.1 hypothetical protein [Deltaproteobacteria bacterium]MBW2323658.1 hypothetical protein [Deltaproteobacteria bacterium]